MKNIRKITLEISNNLLNRIDEATMTDGFNSRSEFLRFLIVTYLKKEHANQTNQETIERKPETDKEDEFADVNLEFGIPIEVIKKLEERARIMTENERQQQS